MADDGERILVSREARLMAADISVHIAAARGDDDAAERAVGACMAWLAEVGERLTRFEPESELARLNAAAGRWFAASELLFAAVERALSAARSSNGLFDPTLLPTLEALGYDRDFSLIAHRNPARAARANTQLEAVTRGAWREIELDMAGQRIRLPRGCRLDLGGIAKGWAADVALEQFCVPFPGALVNVGGDLRLRGGPAAGEAWPVGIADPRNESEEGMTRHAALVTFSRGGLATSGSVRRWWLRDGRRAHHLLDPRTGQPVPLWIDAQDDAVRDAAGNPLLATATALAPTAARAEVAAKLALLRGSSAALAAVESAWSLYGAASHTGGDERDPDTGVALVLVPGSGEVKLSANMSEWLATWGTADAPLPMYIS